MKNELFSRFFCLFAVLCCGSGLSSVLLKGCMSPEDFPESNFFFFS